jgi:hypothetical protein
LNIRSRTISSDHESPSISRAMLIGQPERRSGTALREVDPVFISLANEK